MVWGGLHASIPIALVLGLPRTLPSGAPFPFHEELRAMVFGVAAFSLVVQGLSMGRLLDRLDIVFVLRLEGIDQPPIWGQSMIVEEEFAGKAVGLEIQTALDP